MQHRFIVFYLLFPSRQDASVTLHPAVGSLHYPFPFLDSQFSKKVVLISETITGFKLKIIKRDFVRVIRKRNPTRIGNAVIFAINMELVKVIVMSSLSDLNDKVKSR
ncbi:hypothetical protein LH67_20355 [Xenorhabdus nematophila]|nr:hypothetical protein LH67_20355 [Xenorhabdus nematophila]